MVSLREGLADGSEVQVDFDLAEKGLGEGVVRVKITPEPALINVKGLTGGKGDCQLIRQWGSRNSGLWQGSCPGGTMWGREFGFGHLS